MTPNTTQHDQISSCEDSGPAQWEHRQAGDWRTVGDAKMSDASKSNDKTTLCIDDCQDV